MKRKTQSYFYKKAVLTPFFPGIAKKIFKKENNNIVNLNKHII